MSEFFEDVEADRQDDNSQDYQDQISQSSSSQQSQDEEQSQNAEGYPIIKQNIDHNKKNSQPKNLRSWIKQLNQQDHSQDEGIQDYKIGGYHPCHIGEVLINRYVLIQKLGWGHFSTVWLCKDFKHNTYVAVKVMKSAPHYLDASYDQVQILQKIAKLATSPSWIKSVCKYKNKKPQQIHRDDTHVLNLLNCFLYRGPYGNHFCMVYEILGVNLLEVLKRTNYEGLAIDTVRQITKQILIGLDFLNRICKIIHTDLKPENVLVCLTDQQIKKIVEDGQLSNKDVFKQRLRYYQQNFGFADSISLNKLAVQEVKQIHLKKVQSITKQIILTQDQVKLQALKKRLQHEQLNKNTKKTIRKKIKRIQQKITQQQKTNSESQHNQKQQVKTQQKEKEKEKEESKVSRDILSKAMNPKIVFDKIKPLEQGFKIKIADLGNACWTHYHFATEIQTRQYRGPEVILGSKYNTTADIWSLACMVYEMLTGDLLFTPKKDPNEQFGKNDDHIARIMKISGIFPKKFSKRCSKFRKYFNQSCKLKRVESLQYQSISKLMTFKHKYCPKQAKQLQQFLNPMLECIPQRRTSAQALLSHKWLTQTTKLEDQKLDKQKYEQLRVQNANLQSSQQQEQKWCYESEKEDGSIEDNNKNEQGDSDRQWYGSDAKYKQVSSIKLIDHSFTDVGYTGYSQGIDLKSLDAVSNWQFIS